MISSRPAEFTLQDPSVSAIPSRFADGFRVENTSSNGASNADVWWNSYLQNLGERIGTIKGVQASLVSRFETVLDADQAGVLDNILKVRVEALTRLFEALETKRQKFSSFDGKSMTDVEIGLLAKKTTLDDMSIGDSKLQLLARGLLESTKALVLGVERQTREGVLGMTDKNLSTELELTPETWRIRRELSVTGLLPGRSCLGYSSDSAPYNQKLRELHMWNVNKGEPVPMSAKVLHPLNGTHGSRHPMVLDLPISHSPRAIIADEIQIYWELIREALGNSTEVARREAIEWDRLKRSTFVSAQYPAIHSQDGF